MLARSAILSFVVVMPSLALAQSLAPETVAPPSDEGAVPLASELVHVGVPDPAAPPASAQAPAVPSTSRSDTAPRARRGDRDDPRFRFSLPVVGSVGLGMMNGYLTLHGRAGFAVASVETTPTVENNRLRFRAPIRLRHRQTVGTPWTETYGEGAFAARYAPIRRFRVEVSGGATARLRRAWLDQYQPITVDHLSTTHRYSRWSRFVEAEISGLPFHRNHVRLDYRYEYTDYWADPHYDPYNRPTHLVPQDRTEHALDATWHVTLDRARLGAEMVARHRNYYFSFARDAGSGITHATAANGTPNPLYRVWYLEPTLDARIDPSRRMRLRIAYGHEVQRDAYQGYFSYQGPHPSVDVEWKPTSRLTLEADADVRWRKYGPNSFQPVGSHPPLESGNRRYAHRWHFHLGADYEATTHLAVFFDTSLVIRSSNRPDYVPGVYPVTQQYDIDLDYTNFIATLGVRASR